MGKAKMFGGMAVIIGLILGLVAGFLVPGGFAGYGIFLLQVFLPMLIVTVALIAIIIGILLLIYG